MVNNNKTKPVIDLIYFTDLGLIIPYPSGVIYTNQVGGFGCYHPEVEGIFVPLPVGVNKTLFALENHFRGDWHHIGMNDAKIVNRILRRNDLSFLKVDEIKLKKSFESWIHVDVFETKEMSPLVKGFGNTKGILTWANSD